MIEPLLLAKRVGELVQIPSVNPLQAGPIGGSDGEAALAHRIANWAESLGAEVVLDQVLPGRPNVYARFAGSSDRVIVIDTHLDTVSVEHMTEDPFDGRIQDDRVYGRGAVDTKATFAIVLSVLEELLADGQQPVPSVYVVGTISEEVGGLIGAAGFERWAAQKDLRVDQLIVAEPTLCAPVIGHKGILGLDITVHGHAAHSSKPELGINAISGAAKIVQAIDAENARIQADPAPTDVGNGTTSVTLMKGGAATNIIPDRCRLHAGRRVAPGEDPNQLFNDLTRLVTDAAAPTPVTVEMAGGVCFAAFYQDPDSELVRRVSELAGASPEVATYGSNACTYPDLANEMILFGPGSIDQAHQAVEWIDIAEIAKAADFYRSFLRASF